MSRRISGAETARALSRRGSPALWFGVLGGPAAWFVSLVVSYFSVHEVCRVQTPIGPRLASLAALILAVASALMSRTTWWRVDRGKTDTRDVAPERTRFMAQLGVLGGTLFSLMILLQIIATFILAGCHDRPRTPESPDVLTPPAAHSVGDRA